MKISITALVLLSASVVPGSGCSDRINPGHGVSAGSPAGPARAYYLATCNASGCKDVLSGALEDRDPLVQDVAVQLLLKRYGTTGFKRVAGSFSLLGSKARKSLGKWLHEHANSLRDKNYAVLVQRLEKEVSKEAGHVDVPGSKSKEKVSSEQAGGSGDGRNEAFKGATIKDGHKEEVLERKLAQSLEARKYVYEHKFLARRDIEMQGTISMPLRLQLEEERERIEQATRARARAGYTAGLAYELGLVGTRGVQDFALKLLKQDPSLGIDALFEDEKRAGAIVLANMPVPGEKGCKVASGFLDETDDVTSVLLARTARKCGKNQAAAVVRSLDNLMNLDTFGPIGTAALLDMDKETIISFLDPSRDNRENKSTSPGIFFAMSGLTLDGFKQLLSGWSKQDLETLTMALKRESESQGAVYRKNVARISGKMLELVFSKDVARLDAALVRDRDPAVRREAIAGLVRAAPPSAFDFVRPFISAVLLDGDAMVRRAVAKALSEKKYARWLDMLALMALDHDEQVRSSVVRGVVSGNLSTACDVLAEMALKGPGAVTLQALESMSGPGFRGECGPKVVPYLEKIIDSPDVSLVARKEAMHVLAGMDSSKARDALMKQLFASPPFLGWIAFKALAPGKPGLCLDIAGPPAAKAEAEGTNDRAKNEGPGPRLGKTGFEQAGIQPGPGPVAGLHVSLKGDNKGGRVVLQWIPSQDDPGSKGKPAAGFEYRLYRSSDKSGPFRKIQSMPAGSSEFKDRKGRGRGFYYLVAACSGMVCSNSQVLGPVVLKAGWFVWSRLHILIAVLLFTGLVLMFTRKAGRNPEGMYLRPIPGLDAIREAVGRATEMGKSVLYSTGLGEMSDIGTVASISILSSVAKTNAEYATRLLVPCRDPVVFTAAQQAVFEGCLAAGKPEAYDERDVFFVAGRQFAYAAAVAGMMVREKPGANLFIGLFYAEALLLAETGASTGAVQIAATDRVTQLPFFITSCDYTLIGEELYAAGAYLGKNPSLLGTLKAQDWTKAVLAGILGLGGLLAGWAAIAGCWSWARVAHDALVSLLSGVF
ncbi:MAG: HEAT repeat domain-containing protein [Deltaproteobacteria bacterium]|nr:HEAT repeat domain-containing protein [Deltaproteobacteria bacterium]